MAKTRKQTPVGPARHALYAGISLCATVCAGILYCAGSTSFGPYFGPVNPLAAMALIVLAGFAALRVLISEAGLEISGRRTSRGLLVSSALAALFGIVVILADLIIVFPETMNVPLPESLLFYPAIGFVVEIVFHVLPLAMVFFLLTLFFRRRNPDKNLTFSLAAVSLLEPAYQAVSFAGGSHPLWASAFVGAHVWLINIAQLLVFRRYGFVPMYSLRLAYYLIWHIIWGHARLRLMF